MAPSCAETTPDAGGVAPDETRRLLGQSIDRVEPVHECLELDRIEGRCRPADVEDGEVVRRVQTGPCYALADYPSEPA
jgi:hypothetical protein